MDADSIDDTLIDVELRRGYSRRRQNYLKEATFFELLCELCRRLWRSIRRLSWSCLRYIPWFRVERRRSSVSESSNDSELLAEHHRHETEIQKLQSDISNYQRRLEELSKDYVQLRTSEERLIREKENLESKIGELNMRLEKAATEIEEMRKSKNDALSRLSEMMGAKLRDNNPAITDLNDPNRPMKLGEQFNELYENDWTEAYLGINDAKEEDEKTIEILLNILREVNDQCIAISESQLLGILEPIKDLPKDDTSDFIKSVKDSRKLSALKYVPLLYKKLTGENSQCLTLSPYIDHCQSYIEKCVRICYLAAVQDPPVYLHFEPGQPGDEYDKQVFKEYTQSGIKVRFLVWPAMFLYQGGPLLSKGVVQPLYEKNETD